MSEKTVEAVLAEMRSAFDRSGGKTCEPHERALIDALAIRGRAIDRKNRLNWFCFTLVRDAVMWLRPGQLTMSGMEAIEYGLGVSALPQITEEHLWSVRKRLLEGGLYVTPGTDGGEA